MKNTGGCHEKRFAWKSGSKWDFVRMLPIEVENHRENLAVASVKCFIIFRASQVKAELDLGTTWKTFFKNMWCKIRGRSLAWEIACGEAVWALEKKMPFLRSEEGWASDFDDNMAELLKQPY